MFGKKTDYAGIPNANKIGYGVEENSNKMRRYYYFHKGLSKIQLGLLPLLQRWDIKCAEARHCYEDADAANDFRNRALQLRMNQQVIEKVSDPRLTLLLDELQHAQNDAEFLLAFYQVIKPALIQAYEKHIENDNPMIDYPTVRFMKNIVFDLKEQVQLGNELIQILSKEKIEQAQEFKQKITYYLDACGGASGDGKTDKGEAPVPWRSIKAFDLPERANRDPETMGPTVHGRTYMDITGDPVRDRLVAMMRVRQEEMNPAELLAGVGFSQKDMPFEFQYNIARHVWDEVRHAMLGQAALENEGFDQWMKRPQFTADYDLSRSKIPSTRFAYMAIGIEGGVMNKNGKPESYRFAKEVAKHPLMAYFQDYDWADEVTHVTFGRKWGPELMGGDEEMAKKVAEKELFEIIPIIEIESNKLGIPNSQLHRSPLNHPVKQLKLTH